MKKKYPYYELKNAIDEFVIEYGDLMTEQKWTITSKPCNECDKEFDTKLREKDERFFYITSSGKKKKNIDYLFVERESNGKLTKGINQFLNNFGFEINSNGLIVGYISNNTK
jgi:hypothetical protein